jgi:hypothetical protein
MKMRVIAYEVSWRLGSAMAMVGLLGAGAGTPEDAFGLVQVTMSVEASAREHLPTFADAHSYRVTMAVRGAPRFVAVFDEDTRATKMISDEPGWPTMYFVGSTVYFRSADGAWTKLDARSTAGAHTPKPVANRVDERVERLPDQMLHGVRLGAFRTHVPARFTDRHRPASALLTMTCLYEKATRRMRSCSAPDAFTMVFDRYDDPANRFTLPAAALHAPDAFR